MSVVFLFHIGSIKRDGEEGLRAWRIFSFYSILVRLKVSNTSEATINLFEFLFHIGSIKRCTHNDTDKTVFRFLFHIGSIKSFCLS